MIPEAGTPSEIKAWLFAELWMVGCRNGHREVVDFGWMLEDHVMPIRSCLFCMDAFYRIRTREDNKRHSAVRPRR